MRTIFAALLITTTASGQDISQMTPQELLAPRQQAPPKPRQRPQGAGWARPEQQAETSARRMLRRYSAIVSRYEALSEKLASLEEFQERNRIVLTDRYGYRSEIPGPVPPGYWRTLKHKTYLKAMMTRHPYVLREKQDNNMARNR